MTNKIARKGWYDGWIYATFIDADWIRIRDRLFSLIENDKTILDIGCGTGGFALRLAERSKFVTGVDISGQQIQQANKRLKRSGLKNVNFIHTSATALDQFESRSFDYAIMTLMLHEISHQDRLDILRQVRKVAKRIIILDYNWPLPQTLAGHSIRMIEFLAGRDHFKNFRDFNQRRGLSSLLQSAGISLLEEKVNRSKTFSTVIAE